MRTEACQNRKAWKINGLLNVNRSTLGAHCRQVGDDDRARASQPAGRAGKSHRLALMLPPALDRDFAHARDFLTKRATNEAPICGCAVARRSDVWRPILAAAFERSGGL